MQLNYMFKHENICNMKIQRIFEFLETKRKNLWMNHVWDKQVVGPYISLPKWIAPLSHFSHPRPPCSVQLLGEMLLLLPKQHPPFHQNLNETESQRTAKLLELLGTQV